MDTQALPLSELSRRAVVALIREIGVVGTLRFLGQYTRGAGDYTEERGAFLKAVSLDELVEEARQIDGKKKV